MPEHHGEIHIKAGYLHGGEYYAVKAASGFPGNPARWACPQAMGWWDHALDARTGVPRAILLDNGYITDLRTAAAGAVAAKHLARETVDTVAVIGTGIQARLQPRVLAGVRAFRSLRILGAPKRSGGRLQTSLEESHALPAACTATVSPSVQEAIRDADIVVTVTSSRAPLLRAEWLARGALVVAVGSDGGDKQELDVGVLGSADRVVADSLQQCRRIGEIHHALDAGVIDAAAVTELGSIVNGTAPGRQHAGETVVCDLTGVGVQDVAAASLVVQRARERGVGMELREALA